MDERELNEIRERAEKATPGEWTFTPGTSSWTNPPSVNYANKNKGCIGFEIPFNEDADFIAHSRTDIPALLSEVDRLRSALEADHKDFAMIEHMCNDKTHPYIGELGGDEQQYKLDYIVVLAACGQMRIAQFLGRK